MPARVRLVHKLLGPFHVFTSPDVSGLHASDETMAGAQRTAIAILDFWAERDGTDRPVVWFEEGEALRPAAE